MSNTHTLLLVALLTALCLPAVQAYERHFDHSARFERGNAYSHHDRARVTRVVPLREIVRTSVPQQVCHTEHVTRSYREGADPGAYMIAGTIIGGVLGNQIGRGSGKKAATVAGTVLGAGLGHDIGRHRGHAEVHRSVPEQRCRTVYRSIEEERIRGYRVTYRYQGREYTQDMNYDPGPYVNVLVNITPQY